MSQRILFSLNKPENEDLLFGICIVGNKLFYGLEQSEPISKSKNYLEKLLNIIENKDTYEIKIYAVCDDDKKYYNLSLSTIYFNIDKKIIKFLETKFTLSQISKISKTLNIKLNIYDWINYYSDEKEDKIYSKKFKKNKIDDATNKLKQISNLIYYINNNSSKNKNYDDLKQLHYNYTTQLLRKLKYTHDLKYNPICVSIGFETEENVHDVQYEEKYIQITNIKGKTVGEYNFRRLCEGYENNTYMKDVNPSILDDIIDKLDDYGIWDFFV